MRHLMAACLLSGIWIVAAPAQDRPRPEEGPRPKQGERPGGDFEKARAEVEKAKRELEAKVEAMQRLERDARGGRRGEDSKKDQPRGERNEEPRGKETPKDSDKKVDGRKNGFGRGGFGPDVGGGLFGPGRDGDKGEHKTEAGRPGFMGFSGMGGGFSEHRDHGDGATMLVRRKLVLPAEKAEMIVGLLKKIAENHPLEIKAERDGIVTTTTPPIDHIISGLVHLLGEKSPAK